MRCLATAAILLTLLVPCACATPLQAVATGPHGHGASVKRPGPYPIAWRANAIAAPCALICRPGPKRDIACDCTGVDSIYFSRLDEGWRLGMAEVEAPPPAAAAAAASPPQN